MTKPFEDDLNSLPPAAKPRPMLGVIVGAVIGVMVFGGVVVAVIVFWSMAAPPLSRKLPVFPVSGKVLLDGVPAEGVVVRCIPMDPQVQKIVGSSVGVVEADGTFKLKTYPGRSPDGVPKGDYLVVFFWFKPDDLQEQFNLLPAEYSRPNRFQVHVDGPTTLPPFELKSGKTPAGKAEGVPAEPGPN